MAFRQRVTAPEVDKLGARFLVVQLQATTLAVLADSIRGVLKPEEVRGGEDVVLLGESYRHTSLPQRLKMQERPKTADTRLVLCSRGQGRCVVAVDRVLGLTDIRREDILPLSPLFVGDERLWFRGVFLFQESMALVVNQDWLVHDLDASASALSATR